MLDMLGLNVLGLGLFNGLGMNNGAEPADEPGLLSELRLPVALLDGFEPRARIGPLRLFRVLSPDELPRLDGLPSELPPTVPPGDVGLVNPGVSVVVRALLADDSDEAEEPGDTVGEQLTPGVI